MEQNIREYPLIPLRELVLLPEATVPVLIARPFSLQAARHALSMNEPVVFIAQRDAEKERPEREDLYEVGVLGQFLQNMRDADGSIHAFVQAKERVRLRGLTFRDGMYLVQVEPYPVTDLEHPRVSALVRMIREYLREYLRLPNSHRLPEELAMNLLNLVDDPQYLVSHLVLHLPFETPERQRILEMESILSQLDAVIRKLIQEIEFLKLKQEIQERVRAEITKSQRQYFLQQEMREIQRELGEEEDEFSQLEKEIRAAGMPPEVEKKALKELDKLRKTPPISPEATVLRNYIDWLVSLPWSHRTRDNLDIAHARRILDEDHYGLQEQKDRILEYLSVLKLKGRLRGEVICFVGPPGVGKTSLAKSIARALGRRFVRMSLGGVHDEAEIRGHRRTYVGAMPGRIIQQIRRAGTKNPVFLLDEIDKLGRDFRGDPQAALMEVLDPEVNRHFVDHYLEVEFDLSEVLFIATANSIYGIPGPLRDRMELIPVRGYLDFEKLHIAREHLIPKKLEETGLPKGSVQFTDAAILKIIREYTQESGVRDLERNIARILRKVAREFQETGKKRARITPKKVREYLGLPKKRVLEAKPELPVGAVYGLAWTEYGGELLRVEAQAVQGKGNLELTGQLGEVMKESARAALTFVRAHYKELGLPEDFYTRYDLHVHVPEGAIPKDGPSAGVTILVAMVSALTGIPVSGELAMTGEITLSGDLLPVGGLKEKLLAAKRYGIKRVFLPAANRPDVQEMEREITEDLEITFVETLEQLVRQVFPFPRREKPSRIPREDRTEPWIHAG